MESAVTNLVGVEGGNGQGEHAEIEWLEDSKGHLFDGNEQEPRGGQMQDRILCELLL